MEGRRAKLILVQLEPWLRRLPKHLRRLRSYCYWLKYPCQIAQQKIKAAADATTLDDDTYMYEANELHDQHCLISKIGRPEVDFWMRLKLLLIDVE